jgi:hypothetical protein
MRIITVSGTPEQPLTLSSSSFSTGGMPVSGVLRPPTPAAYSRSRAIVFRHLQQFCGSRIFARLRYNSARNGFDGSQRQRALSEKVLRPEFAAMRISKSMAQISPF